MIALLPDVERLITSYLREQPELTALVGDRVYTAFPERAGMAPLLLVQRIGGLPAVNRPLVLDEADLQLDAYGGRKVEAHELIATTRALLGDLEGLVRAEGTVTAVTFGALRWQPDDTYKPSRPRYVADVTVHARPPTASARAAALTPLVGDRLAAAATT